MGLYTGMDVCVGYAINRVSVPPAELGLCEIEHKYGLVVLRWLDEFYRFVLSRGSDCRERT
jgi:hypothetical protein